EMRFLEGMIPAVWDGRTSDDSLTRLWLRDALRRPLDFPSVTAMADIFFPRVWLRRAALVPMGTVSMTVYFHVDAAQLAADADSFLLVQARGQAFAGGFFDHAGQLWNESGALLATTHQVVYYKE
ncbi:MAG TPA: thioesterase family protein, partial [Ramlibacter sp.]